MNVRTTMTPCPPKHLVNRDLEKGDALELRSMTYSSARGDTIKLFFQNSYFQWIFTNLFLDAQKNRTERKKKGQLTDGRSAAAPLDLQQMALYRRR